MTLEEHEFPEKSKPEGQVSKYSKSEAFKDAGHMGTALAKATVGLIPGLGGFVNEMYDGFRDARQRRKEELLRRLIDNHGVEIDELKTRLGSDDELADLVMRGFEAASKASFEEKLDMLADAVMGIFDANSTDRVFARILFSVIDLLEREHVEVMLEIKQWREISQEERENAYTLTKVSANNVNLSKKLPHLEPVMGIITSTLESQSIIRNDITGTYLDIQAPPHYVLDHMGDIVLRYIHNRGL